MPPGQRPRPPQRRETAAPTHPANPSPSTPSSSSNPLTIPGGGGIGITPNWMSTVNSPTYNLSFYFVDTAVWSNPSQWLINDSAAINSGKAVIIAKSGVTTTYSIDNLVINSIPAGGTEETANISTGSLQFEILEVLGFELNDRINSLAQSYGYENMQNSKYVLKVEFKGRNPNSDQPVNNPSVFLFSVQLQNITASIGPDGARYMITAIPMSRYTADRIQTPTAISFQYTTVADFITELQGALNENERNLRTQYADQTPEYVGKTWAIEYDDLFAQLLEENMRGLSEGSTGTSEQAEPGKATKSITPSTNIASMLRDVMNSEIPKLTESRDVAGWPEGLAKIVVEQRTEATYPPRMDPLTNQLEEQVIITLHVARSFEVESNADTPSEEVSARTSPTTQNQLLNNMNGFIYKRYDYLYTGLNTEILDLDLNIDASYFSITSPSFGAGYTDASATVAQRTIPSDTTPPPPARGFMSSVATRGIPGLITPIFEFVQTRAADQNHVSAEGDGVAEAELDRIQATMRAFMNLDMRIKGDPFWLGTPDIDRGPGTTQIVNANFAGDLMLIFINYFPHEAVTYETGAHRGRLDHLTTGVYRVASISSRFQAGKFTQELRCTKRDNLTTALVANRLTGRTN